MRSVLKYRILTVLFAAAALSGGAVELPAIFSNAMVLQRDRQIPIWGTGRPGEAVTVEFNGKSEATAVRPDGSWELFLPPMPADSRNLTLTVKGDNTLTFTEVLIGDVWICAGQSNMQFNLSKINGGEKLVAESGNPRIRLFQVPRAYSRKPEKALTGKWVWCNPYSAAKFPAIGYLAGLAISNRVDVPVGLINLVWGGSRIESVTAREAYQEITIAPEVAKDLDRQFARLDVEEDEQLGKNAQRLPSTLFNAMVYPLTPFAVRGVFYYQGEDNHKDGSSYEDKLRAWAYSWRKYFKHETMPIYLVQLPPYAYNAKNFEVPKLRAAQQSFAGNDPHSGFVVATDYGDAGDIHPLEKAPLAKRLADLVLFREYGIGDDSVLSPAFRRCTVEGGRVIVEFSHPNGLKTRDGKTVSHLELAGEDGVFFPATGVVEGDRLVVSADQVPRPEKIRFGWHELADPNLVNRSGVPAAPFEAKPDHLRKRVRAGAGQPGLSSSAA